MLLSCMPEDHEVAAVIVVMIVEEVSKKARTSHSVAVVSRAEGVMTYAFFSTTLIFNPLFDQSSKELLYST